MSKRKNNPILEMFHKKQKKELSNVDDLLVSPFLMKSAEDQGIIGLLIT